MALNLKSSSSPSLGRLDLDLLQPFIRRSAAALFLIYLITAITQFLPLRIRDPGWAQQFIDALIHNATLALAGVFFAVIARIINATSRSNRRLLKFIVRLTLPVAIGFILLVPLQIFTSIRILGIANSNAESEAYTQSQQFDALRSQVKASGTPSDLAKILGRLPRAETARFLDRPLEQAKTLIGAEIDKAEEFRQAERIRILSRERFNLFLASLRNIVSSVALAVAFYSARRAQVLKALKVRKKGSLRTPPWIKKQKVSPPLNPKV